MSEEIFEFDSKIHIFSYLKTFHENASGKQNCSIELKFGKSSFCIINVNAKSIDCDELKDRKTERRQSDAPSIVIKFLQGSEFSACFIINIAMLRIES